MKICRITLMLIIIALAVSSRIAAYAGTISVNINDGSCVAAPQGDPYSVVYCSIEDAISDATSGDTIEVAAGTYAERLNINKSLTLVGANQGVDPNVAARGAESIITEAGLITTNPDVLIEIPSSNTVTIDGFTLNGDPTTATADTSIVRSFADNLTIENNIMDGKVGVLFNSAAASGDNVTIAQNQMTVNKNGVVMFAQTTDNLAISDNTFSPGTSLFSDPAAIQMSHVNSGVISDNTATGFVGGRGLGGSDLDNLDIFGNSFTGGKDSISVFGGITFLDISSNDLSSNSRHGINIKGADISITGNDIIGNGDSGINIDKHVIDTERVTISCNNITGNTNFGVKAANASDIINAGNNWWGDASGPFNATSNPGGAGDDVSDGVAFTPWLTGPAPLVPGAYTCVGFEPPMDNGAVKVKKNKVLPLKCQLIDGDGNPVTDADISSPPVIQVIFTPLVGPAEDVTDDALPAGKGSVGNQLAFDSAGGKWAYNLMTKNYSALGTYTITIITGNACEYSIVTCIAVFIIE